MFTALIISILSNIFLIVLTTKFLSVLSIIHFSVIIYIVPLIFNSLLTSLNYKKLPTHWHHYIYPLFSFIAYLVVGFILKGSLSWESFVQQHSITNGEMYVKVSSDLLDISQISFVILLYFLSEFTILTFLKRRNR